MEAAAAILVILSPWLPTTTVSSIIATSFGLVMQRETTQPEKELAQKSS